MDTSDMVRDETVDPIPIAVPQLGVVQSVVVVEWLVTAGEVVREGQPVVSVDTDKVDTDIEAPAAGCIEIAVQAGPDEVPVGTVLGYVVADA